MFTKRKPITVSNSTGGSLTNHPVELSVTYDADMASDFSDLAFSNSGGDRLYHWIESYTASTSATIWIKCDSLGTGDNTIYMYYAPDDPITNQSNGTNTFDLFDDFSTYNGATEIGDGKFPTDFCKIGSTIYLHLTDYISTNIEIWKSTDNGTSWSLEVTVETSSTYVQGGIDTDGTDLFIIFRSSTGIFFRKYIVSTTTLNGRVTIASGLTNPKNPVILYRSGSGSSINLWALFRDQPSNYNIECYESTDSGSTWSFRETVQTDSIALEDLDVLKLNNGNILLAWEREEAEEGAASIRQKIWNGSWGDESTIVDNSTYDDEGGAYIYDPNGYVGNKGDIFYVYSTNKDGGISYKENLAYRLKSGDGGVTWGNEELLSVSENSIEAQGVIDNNGKMLLSVIKGYDGSAAYTDMTGISFHAVESTDLDFNDNGWLQDQGGAWPVKSVGNKTCMSVRGFTPDTQRGFLSNSYSSDDYVLEGQLRAGGGTVHARVCVRYTDAANDHYLIVFTATQAILYKRDGGAYSTIGSAGTISMSANTWYTFKVQVDGTSIKIWFNDTLEVNTTDVTFSSGKIALSTPAGSNTYPAYFTDIRTRPYVDPDPTTSEGSEETGEWTISGVTLIRRYFGIRTNEGNFFNISNRKT